MNFMPFVILCRVTEQNHKWQLGIIFFNRSEIFNFYETLETKRYFIDKCDRIEKFKLQRVN